MEAIYGSPEFGTKNLSNAEFVSEIYNDLLGRIPDPEGGKFWTDALNNGLARVELVGAIIDIAGLA